MQVPDTVIRVDSAIRETSGLKQMCCVLGVLKREYIRPRMLYLGHFSRNADIKTYNVYLLEND